jgi:4-hydroxy-2-oxoheptanedioate aldolase
MELPLNHFKRALKAGKLQVGIWNSLPDNISAEILAGSGFDWMLIDTEHTLNDLRMVCSQLQAVGGGATHPVVRPPWNDTVMLKRFLDIGVQSFLIPMVQDEEEARKAVAATRYAPRGVRGFASAPRAAGYGRVADYFARCEQEICVLVQIETPKALDNIEKIAAVEGIDGIFIGPGDLSAAMGYIGNPGHPEARAAIDGAIERIKACGVPAGILTGNEAMARHYIDMGCLFTAVGSDVGVLTKGLEQLAQRFKPAG